MKASYKKLWKLLIDKEMSKGDLRSNWLVVKHHDQAQKRRRCFNGGSSQICTALDCNIGDIVEFVPDTTES